MKLLTLSMIKVTKDDGPFELSMATLITHGCDQDDMLEDVGIDDYVDTRQWCIDDDYDSVDYDDDGKIILTMLTRIEMTVIMMLILWW